MAKRKAKDLQEAQVVKDDLSPKQEGHPSVGKYWVQLTYLPAMEVEASDEKEAVELYNKFLGVIKTENRYEVKKI